MGDMSISNIFYVSLVDLGKICPIQKTVEIKFNMAEHGKLNLKM